MMDTPTRTTLDKKIPVYAPFEVILHNTPEDCWLSFLGKVFDVTPLVDKYKDKNCIKPILAFAGKDVSHWFDAQTGEIQKYIHPVTGVPVPYCPHGPLPEVPLEAPTPLWRPIEGTPWWKSDNLAMISLRPSAQIKNRYQVGILTKLVRPLRILNMLICKEVQINVCEEDNFYRIAERYSIFNSDTDSYIWTYLGKLVDMDKTLDENGIPDEREKFSELGLPKSFYVPSVSIYYMEDFKYVEDLSDDEEEVVEKTCCVCPNRK